MSEKKGALLYPITLTSQCTQKRNVRSFTVRIQKQRILKIGATNTQFWGGASNIKELFFLNFVQCEYTITTDPTYKKLKSIYHSFLYRENSKFRATNVVAIDEQFHIFLFLKNAVRISPQQQQIILFISLGEYRVQRTLYGGGRDIIFVRHAF